MEKKKGIKILANQVFEKARRESNKETPYGLCKYLHEHVGLSISERNLTRYYDYFVLHKKKEKINPDEASLNEISKYLGYDSFQSFLEKREEKAKVLNCKKEKEVLKERLFLSVLGNIILALVLWYFVFKSQEKNCMVWVEDHYEKTKCSGAENEKALNLVVFSKMKKIISPMECNYDMWYSKVDNTIEFFSHYGEHPITSNTLKKVTKHICEKYVLKGQDSVLEQNEEYISDCLIVE